jgi:hypothetical protein
MVVEIIFVLSIVFIRTSSIATTHNTTQRFGNSFYPQVKVLLHLNMETMGKIPIDVINKISMQP